MSKKVLTHTMSEPLGGASSVKAAIEPGDGNLMIDGVTAGEAVLASGTLQYLEKQGLPIQSLEMADGKATFTLKAGGKGQSWMRLPWSACNGATEWQIHLNPTVPIEIAAHSDGGNVTVNLTGMKVSSVSADTGGGNMEVTLPATAAGPSAAGLSVAAKSGAGNVTVRIPVGIAARIHASTGLGAVIVAPRFIKIDGKTYQSPDFDSAGNKAEITAVSGAGNVIIE